MRRNTPFFSYLLFEFLFRRQLNTITLLVIIGFTSCAVSAYLDNVVEHNIFCFTINLVFMIIWIRQIILIGLSVTLPLFFSVLYLNFKFKEIFEGLKKSIETKSRRMMFCSVIKHSKASDLTRNLNEYILYIIGMAYGFGSANMVITFICASDQSLNFGIRITFLGLFPLILIVYSENLMSASVTTANKSVAKHLYPIFIENRFRNLYLNMKIEAFIARLNGDFIGFYC